MRYLFHQLYLFIAGHHPWSPCWLGLHCWSMPGGWCERCGKCDIIFRDVLGDHDGCGKVCKHFIREKEILT